MKLYVSIIALTTLLLTVVWATNASAEANVFSVTSGGLKYQIGNGLPIPIVGSAVPSGNAEVIQAIGLDPRNITLKPGKFVRQVPAQPFNIPVLAANPYVWQVQTNISIHFPIEKAVFAAGGRTGPETATFCAGQVGFGTPCINPEGGTGIHGLLQYRKTAAQFGGAARAKIDATAYVFAVSLNPGIGCNNAVGNCQVGIVHASPAPTNVVGAAFGDYNSTFAPALKIHNIIAVQGSGAGVVAFVDGNLTSITPTGMATATTNGGTSYGGPWTTGLLKISVTLNAGATDEIFMMQGSDTRQYGVGKISLVAGGMSERHFTGPNGNRGWLTMTLAATGETIPSMSAPGYAAFFGLMALAGGYALRRRNH